jgi:hypothetical protein
MTSEKASSESYRDEDLDQKISDAYCRLDQLGKSPEDVIASFPDLESLSTQWSGMQIVTALEFLCLCAFRQIDSSLFTPDVTATIALWYGDAVNRRRIGELQGRPN